MVVYSYSEVELDKSSVELRNRANEVKKAGVSVHGSDSIMPIYPNSTYSQRISSNYSQAPRPREEADKPEKNQKNEASCKSKQRL